MSTNDTRTPFELPSEHEVDPATEHESPFRTYIRIRPTTDSLVPETVHTHVRRLYQVTANVFTRRWYHHLVPRWLPTPTVECLLVSDGRDDTDIRYYFGIDQDRALDALERALRGLFPDTYEFERTEWHPDAIASITDSTTGMDSDVDTPHFAGVEFKGQTERHDDWQTQLMPFVTFYVTDEETQTRVPLAAVAEIMATTSVPIVYQVLLRPRPDWSGLAERRRIDLEANLDTPSQKVLALVFGGHNRDNGADRTSVDGRPPRLNGAHHERLEELGTKDPRACFDVNVRAVAIARPESDIGAARAAVEELSTALAPVGHTTYEITGTVPSGDASDSTRSAHYRIFEHIRDRVFRTRGSLTRRLLPWTHTTRPVIVADPTEVPNFFLIGGDALTAAGSRAIAPTPGERTSLPRPPVERLAAYRGEGLTLGRPLTADDTPDLDPLVLPPALQRLHVAWFGKTGSGKSTSLINAILDNHAATQGADILIDPKGDGMAIDYLRAHYARFGHLDNVLYFDCSELLPAFSFFDIRDELDAGIPRTTAVEDKVDHYIEILMQIMGRDRFEQAVRSPDVIRYLVKAAFDPINGQDAFSHRDLHAGARQMHERQAAPPVSDSDLEQALGGVVANRARTFDEIMAGVANRLEKIPVDQRLARIFNHVPEAGDPHFDLATYLNDDVVIVFDTGGLRSEAQRVLALVILSNLWTALRRRKRHDSDENHPLVNLYVEEAASIAVSDLLKSLLAQSRGFDCSVTLAMQFPTQLRTADETAYDEVLNNVSTFVTGNVPVDRRLAERLATDDMDARAVGNRLRALRRGQWLVSLPAAFDEPEPRPFLVSSLAPPPGDPVGTRPLSIEDRRTFEDTVEYVHDRTLTDAGLTLGEPSAAQLEDEDADEYEDIPEMSQVRVDSALPHTKRMPLTVQYQASIHALRCTECDNRYDPDIDGMKRAIACCSSLEETDREDVPICDLNLKLSIDELASSELTVKQLLFLQAVYNAQQLRYDPLEYDLVYDSMLRLQEYVGIDSDAVQDLIDADLLRHDTDHPHRLFTVTPEGRNAIGESYRQGVDYGHGAGDLEESSEHVFAVEVTRRYLERKYAENPDSAVIKVVPYYDLDERRRLDIAGLDADGEIIVTVEVERVNNDVLRAVPEDFDKMAACDPEEAIWVVMTRQDGHDVLTALNDPPDGEPRVEKTYAPTTPPQQFRIDTPGLTTIYPVEYVRDSFLDE